MLSTIFLMGLVAGVLGSLLVLKLAPVKVSFDWQSSSAVSTVKSKLRKFRPDYCEECDDAPCQEEDGH